MALSAIEKLARLHPAMCRAYEEEVRENYPDSPLPTLAAGDMAVALARVHGLVPDGVFAAIAQSLERTLEDGPQQDREIVTTGFLEAWLESTDARPNVQERLLSVLGPLGAAYVAAWNDFTGVTE